MDTIKKIIKWLCWGVAAIFAFLVLLAIFVGKEKPNNKEQTEKKQTEQLSSKQETKKEDSFLGTYEVTDKVGCTIRITLNEDETATITGVKGEGVTYYCSWSDFTSTYGGIRVWYGDTEKVPYLVFEGGDNVKKNRYNPGGCLSRDGWYYVTINEAKAKDPNWRLKATKIE